jgi:hypothetical protein
MLLCFYFYHPLHPLFVNIQVRQCLIQLLGDIAGPRDVEALKNFVLNEAEKAGEAAHQDEL